MFYKNMEREELQGSFYLERSLPELDAHRCYAWMVDQISFVAFQSQSEYDFMFNSEDMRIREEERALLVYKLFQLLLDLLLTLRGTIRATI